MCARRGDAGRLSPALISLGNLSVCRAGTAKRARQFRITMKLPNRGHVLRALPALRLTLHIRVRSYARSPKPRLCSAHLLG